MLVQNLVYHEIMKYERVINMRLVIKSVKIKLIEKSKTENNRLSVIAFVRNFMIQLHFSKLEFFLTQWSINCVGCSGKDHGLQSQSVFISQICIFLAV